ncbi:putative N-formylglutamate amidohydrolase [Rhizobium azooxidifex]|uniref:Putative N-formylglutamate amidohydrolase n=1 Tax=Mycoplana azooxidifex TaxID=1636188 RepID=A0A7W6GHG8_9HYPH|nr:N-formylglutamate amidohydrolase [Mycoplana azooxidifex]MBB3975395.1 putative N-formylglutamate amidohydrolase [Mycoplana azooxidifex]
MGILTDQEGDPVAVENAEGRSRFILVCEHASRRIPEHFGTLGLSIEALESHIAWDPGALAVSRMMAKSLDATLVHQRFSRLVYDCNRPPDSPGAMPATSEIYPVPGNAALTPEARLERARTLYFPFRDRIADLVRRRLADGRAPAIVTVHSFTPVYFGKPRAVEIGILHDSDGRLADAVLAAAAGGGSLFDVRRNEPYGPEDGVTHTLKEHGLANGLLNVMIEIRNDLVRDEAGQGVVADYLTGLLLESLPGAS